MTTAETYILTVFDILKVFVCITLVSFHSKILMCELIQILIYCAKFCIRHFEHFHVSRMTLIISTAAFFFLRTFTEAHVLSSTAWKSALTRREMRLTSKQTLHGQL